MKPLLVDLYCGAGGATRGYQLAGFRVLGVDHRPQPRYVGDEFVQADALEWLAGTDLLGVAAIHASPPCQAYSVSTKALRQAGKQYPDLLAATRSALELTGLPWVIENVPGAPLRPDLMLCGCMFNLPGLKRQRWFELSWQSFELCPPCHHPDPIVTVIGHGPNQHSHYRYVPGVEWTALKHAAMGIDWMNREELGEAIPPAYTHHIGVQLLDLVGRERDPMTTLTRTAWGLDSPRGDEWLDHAACRGHPEREPDDWHPISAMKLSDANLAALLVCRVECPVRARCAQFYAEHPELRRHPVVAGGVAHNMSVDAVRSAERRLGTLPACDGLTGTRSGYLRHLVLRSPPCEPCAAANRQVWRDRVA